MRLSPSIPGRNQGVVTVVLKSAAENVEADRPSSLDEGFNVVPIGRTDQLSDEADYQWMLCMDEGFDDGFRPRRAIGAKEPCPLAAQALFHAPAGALTHGALAKALPVSVVRIRRGRSVACGASDDLHPREMTGRRKKEQDFLGEFGRRWSGRKRNFKPPALRHFHSAPDSLSYSYS